MALDQSTKITGYSVWENNNLVDYGVLEANTKEKNPVERMYQMYFLVKDLINKLQPNFVSIEGVQFQNNFATYGKLSQVQGIIISILFNINVPFIIVEPSVWKSFCGIKGRKRVEQKANTIVMVKDKFDIEVSEDIADAIGIGYYTVNKAILDKQ